MDRSAVAHRQSSSRSEFSEGGLSGHQSWQEPPINRGGRSFDPVGRALCINKPSPQQSSASRARGFQDVYIRPHSVGQRRPADAIHGLEAGGTRADRLHEAGSSASKDWCPIVRFCLPTLAARVRRVRRSPRNSAPCRPRRRVARPPASRRNSGLASRTRRARDGRVKVAGAFTILSAAARTAHGVAGQRISFGARRRRAQWTHAGGTHGHDRGKGARSGGSRGRAARRGGRMTHKRPQTFRFFLP